MFVVVKKSARKVLDETKFDNRKDAERWQEFAQATARPGIKYVIEERA